MRKGEGFAGYPSSALRYTVPLELWVARETSNPIFEARPNRGPVQQTLDGRANDAPSQAWAWGRARPPPGPPSPNRTPPENGLRCAAGRASRLKIRELRLQIRAPRLKTRAPWFKIIASRLKLRASRLKIRASPTAHPGQPHPSYTKTTAYPVSRH